jgi:hypothetical protein
MKKIRRRKSRVRLPFSMYRVENCTSRAVCLEQYQQRSEPMILEQMDKI